MSVEVFDTPDELAEAAAHAFVEDAREAMAERGRFVVALAGGSTPKATYEILARDHADAVDWTRVHVFFGDERTVPPDHEDSNYRMARAALLDHVPVGSAHPMRGELPPGEAAASYEEDLEEFRLEEAITPQKMYLAFAPSDRSRKLIEIWDREMARMYRSGELVALYERLGLDTAVWDTK